MQENRLVPATRIPLSRRDFLQGSGLLIGRVAAGSTLAALAPSTVWAVELKTLTTTEGQGLMAFGRTLYPHDRLPDAVYALLVKDLDTAATGDPAKAALLRAGLSGLDKAAAGGVFARAAALERLAIAKSIEGQPFFALVRGQCVTSLYDNALAWQVFGYEGPAWDKGGYITRGFQDLKWLPDPPADASPAPWFG